MSSLMSKIYRWNRSLHRDIGYLCALLTVIYGISGIAVNHVADWNPSYDISRVEELVSLSLDPDHKEFIPHVIKQLDISENVKGGYRASPNEYKIFLEEEK